MTPDIHDRSVYPSMAHWFNPVLISKLLWKVIVSDVFGQYADRRLMVAALIPSPPKNISNEREQAACPSMPMERLGSISWRTWATGSTRRTPSPRFWQR